MCKGVAEGECVVPSLGDLLTIMAVEATCYGFAAYYVDKQTLAPLDTRRFDPPLADLMRLDDDGA